MLYLELYKTYYSEYAQLLKSGGWYPYLLLVVDILNYSKAILTVLVKGTVMVIVSMRWPLQIMIYLQVISTGLAVISLRPEETGIQMEVQDLQAAFNMPI